MSLQIKAVTAKWQNGLPTTANLVENNLKRETRIHWGTPDNGGTLQSSFGFSGVIPPVKFLQTGDRFNLGVLRHFNHRVDCPCLETIDLVLTLDVADDGQHVITIPIAHNETDNITGDSVLDSDIVTLSGGFPQDLTFPANGGTATIRLVGFKTEAGTLVTEFTSPENSVNQVWLIADVIDDGWVIPVCDVDVKSVFNPAGCVIDCVPPIEDWAIINDCGIPDAPPPIMDCPAIDIPTGVIVNPPLPPYPPNPPPECPDPWPELPPPEWLAGTWPPAWPEDLPLDCPDPWPPEPPCVWGVDPGCTWPPTRPPCVAPNPPCPYPPWPWPPIPWPPRIPGPPGRPGRPGRPGVDGCTPRIYVSHGFTCVDRREDVKVVMFSTPVGLCDVLIYFFFYTYCPSTYASACCHWIWTPCDDDYCTEGFVETTDEDCPHTENCTAAPGQWTLFSGDASCGSMPCNEGDYYGQVEISCFPTICYSSSSSSYTPSGDCCCVDDGTDTFTTPGTTEGDAGWTELAEAPMCLEMAVTTTGPTVDAAGVSVPDWCCDTLSVGAPCGDAFGETGNNIICKDEWAIGVGPVPSHVMPEVKCLAYGGNIKVACGPVVGGLGGSTAQPCYRDWSVWLYCYEEDDPARAAKSGTTVGKTYWAFYASIYPYEIPITPLDPWGTGGGDIGGGGMDHCAIHKLGILAQSCTPLTFNIVIDPEDYDDDGDLERCEACTFIIDFNETDPPPWAAP